MKKIIVLCAVLFSSIMLFALDDITTPYPFVAGTPAKASEVNGNFDTTVNNYNRLMDSLEIKYARFTDFADSVLNLIQADSGLIDTLFGDTAKITNISSTKIDVDTTVGDSASFTKVGVSGAFNAATVNTGEGANELFAMDQDVQSGDAVDFATVNTGEGDNELFDMDQNVLTTSDVEFSRIGGDSANISGKLVGDTAEFSHVTASTLSGVSFAGIATDSIRADSSAQLKLYGTPEETFTTISGDTLYASSSYMRVATEGAAALDTIRWVVLTGTLLQQVPAPVIYIQSDVSSRDIFIREVTANNGIMVSSAGNFTLSDPYDSYAIIRHRLGRWVEFSRSDNN